MEAVNNIKYKYLKDDETKHKSRIAEQIMLVKKEPRKQKNNPTPY